jgi:hypothetical protein
MSSDATLKSPEDGSSRVEAESKRSRRKDKKQDASTGAKAAGIRAISSQLLAFYFRAPVKAFFRSRVEYVECVLRRQFTNQAIVTWYAEFRKGDGIIILTFRQAYARSINPRALESTSWSWHLSTPGLLTYAVRTHGWGFIPNQVLPPLLANVR